MPGLAGPLSPKQGTHSALFLHLFQYPHMVSTLFFCKLNTESTFAFMPDPVCTLESWKIEIRVPL